MNSSPRAIRARTLPLTVALALASLAACGGGDKPPAKPGISTAEAKREYVAKKLDEARAALKDGEPRKARNAAEEARNVSSGGDLERVLTLVGEIDAAEAKGVAKEAVALASGHQCREAVDTVASFVTRVPSPTPASLTALRAAAGEKLVACVRADVDEAVAKGKFSRARAMIDSPSTTASLDEATWTELSAKLHAAIASALATQIGGDLKAGRYDAAVAKIRDAVASGEVGKEDEQGALGLIRETVTAPQQKKVDAAIGGAKADEALAELDGLTKLLAWELPKELATSRSALAIWVECRRLGCAPAPKPEPRFVFGKTEVHPSEASGAQATASLASASKVLVVARSGAMSLVLDGDARPAAGLKDHLLAARGWVSNERLETTDTADWLLPDDELVGQRVFGAFSDKDKLFHLGVVTAVAGADATVKRFSDDRLVTVPRASLRSGRAAPGTKVLTTCKNPLKVEPATVEAEVPQAKGMALFHLVCVADGKTAHDEVPGALATKPEWLPPRKP